MCCQFPNPQIGAERRGWGGGFIVIEAFVFPPLKVHIFTYQISFVFRFDLFLRLWGSLVQGSHIHLVTASSPTAGTAHWAHAGPTAPPGHASARHWAHRWPSYVALWACYALGPLVPLGTLVILGTRPILLGTLLGMLCTGPM